MSNVFIDFAGIFHVKDDLFRFIDTMEDHQKVLIFTINSENDFKAGTTRLIRLEKDEVASVEYWLYLEGCDEQCINEVQSKTSDIQLAFAGVEVE